MVAVACLALGLALILWAPSARADETSPDAVATQPPLDTGGTTAGDTTSGGSGTIENPPPDTSGGTGTVENPPPDSGSGGGGGTAVENPPPDSGSGGGGGTGAENPPPDSGSGGGGGTAVENPPPDTTGSQDPTSGGTASDSQHESAPSTATITFLDPPPDPPTALTDPLTPIVAPGILPTSFAGADTFDIFDFATLASLDSGGAGAILMRSLMRCACYAGSRGLLGPDGSGSRLHPRGEPPPDRAKASEPTAPGSGGPGSHLFGVFGGGGGAAAGFLLLSFIAVLTGALRRRELTIDLRLPTARWWPSAYVPPIESPG